MKFQILVKARVKFTIRFVLLARCTGEAILQCTVGLLAGWQLVAPL